jgi:hypothetical protein
MIPDGKELRGRRVGVALGELLVRVVVGQQCKHKLTHNGISSSKGRRAAQGIERIVVRLHRRLRLFASHSFSLPR